MHRRKAVWRKCEKISKAVKNTAEDGVGDKMEKSILTFEHVTGIKRFGKFILQDINFDLKAGYIYGLMGKNGAGKTTLMQYILRDTIPYDGHILIEGTDIRTDHAQILNRIGYVSEDRQFFENCTAAQNAEILGALYEKFHKRTFVDIMDFMNLSAGREYESGTALRDMPGCGADACLHPVVYAKRRIPPDLYVGCRNDSKSVYKRGTESEHVYQRFARRTETQTEIT